MKPDSHRRVPVKAPLRRGPGGRFLCRQCGNEVPPPPSRRETFCSDACVEAWQLLHWPSHQRHRVYERDHGVCALCGLDTDDLASQYRAAARAEWVRVHGPSSMWQPGMDVQARLTALGFHPNRSFWDMDHTVPVIEGGGSCGLDNLRTLCRPCHRRETAALAARRAAARRERAREADPQPALPFTREKP